MATGLPKTKWNGNIKKHITKKSNNGFNLSLSYYGKTPEKKILETENIKIISLFNVYEDKGNQNSLYYSDNLPVLKTFLQNNCIKGKIKLIYIDPPFATKSIFQSRSQNDAYCDLLSGSDYIEFLRKRLIVLRELLADDGSIYVHLNGNMAFYIKTIMDEIFSPRNFRGWITRKKCNPKNYTKKTYGDISDFILFYTKSDKYIWNRPLEKWTTERAKKEYSYIEKGTGRRFKKVPIHAPGIRNGETGKSWRGMNPPPGKHWQFIPKKLDEIDKRGEIYWSPTGNPRRKIYLDNSKGIPIQNIWFDFPDAHNQNIKITGYPTEKNPELIARIIKASSNPGDLVLDCFSGSGTTLQVASELKRKWIGVDNSIEAIIKTFERFVKGTKPMGDFVKRNKKVVSQRNANPIDLSFYTIKSYKKNVNKLLMEINKIIEGSTIWKTQENSFRRDIVKNWKK